jgi:hypothetical protein
LGALSGVLIAAIDVLVCWLCRGLKDPLKTQ